MDQKTRNCFRYNLIEKKSNYATVQCEKTKNENLTRSCGVVKSESSYYGYSHILNNGCNLRL
jgi:hypothetical protein